MAISSSLDSIQADDFGYAQARHLLIRTGAAPTSQEIAQTLAWGLDQAVDRVVRYQQVEVEHLPEPDVDPDLLRPPTKEERKIVRQARREGDAQAQEILRKERQRRQKKDREMMAEIQRWWLDRMLHTPRPMEESLTLLWHSHFASRYRNVRDAYLMYQQNEFFRKNANGSFADLARGVIRDPAMLKFLNNDRNVARKPNENLARELMELFTLGEGHYTEEDIKQGARALTGYHVNDNDFSFRSRQHDRGSKTLLGQRGKYDGDDFVDLLLRNRQCSRYLAFKIYRHFVADVDENKTKRPRDAQAVIEQMSRQLWQDGYQLQPTLVTLFKSQHFYDAAIVGNKIKSPVQLLVGTMRSLGTPMRSTHDLGKAMTMMGQVPFNPPSVAGWDTGRSWINTSTLFMRQNLCVYLIAGKKKKLRDYDPMPLLAEVEHQPQAVVDHLVDLLLGPHVPESRRRPLVAFMEKRPSRVTADQVAALLVLITGMPEYQLC